MSVAKTSPSLKGGTGVEEWVEGEGRGLVLCFALFHQTFPQKRNFNYQKHRCGNVERTKQLVA